ncbi:MAG: HAMP domain-containing histidine kinase [Bdellovibrio sp.]|nr:HAMP domain-containing histidine kinase [Bdellovibrio sp.]
MNSRFASRKIYHILLVIAGMLVTFTIILLVNFNTTTEIFNKGVEIWRPEIAKALADERWMIMDKIGQSISTHGIESIRILRAGRLVYSFPPMVAEASCSFLTVHPLQHYGVILGEMHICRSMSYHLITSFFSPLFLSVVLFVLLFSVAVKATALRIYRNTILNTLVFLKKWASDSNTALDVNDEIKSQLKKRKIRIEDTSDPIEKEFLELVRTGTNIRLENEKFRSRILMSETRSEVARQVAHDIRSPLAALDMVVRDLSQLPEDRRIIARGAVNRIRDIANALLTKSRGDKIVNNATQTSAIIAPQLLFSLIDIIVTEKRMQFRSKLGINIEARLDASSYGLFASLDTVEFKRVVSNLINNAVEALGEKGQVEVILSGNESHANIRICDNGKGIVPEILKRLGEKGETHGKKEGSGLGLYHAKTYLKNCGGSLTLDSELDNGTVATIVLPIVHAPDWFVPRLTFVDGETVVILDDDASIHQIWQGRLDAALRANKKQIHVMHFSTESEIYTWHETCGKYLEQVIYLVDFELLGQKTNGLEIIEKLKIQKHSILVTSRHEEPSVCEQCHRLKVRIIPKGMACFIPIEFQASLETPNCILIDDDELVHMAWKAAAKKAGKQFIAFTKASDFFGHAAQFDKNTPIYVDVNLGNRISGEDVAKEICELGFKNIFLATGYEPERYQHLSFLNGVVSKDPPFNFSRNIT